VLVLMSGSAVAIDWAQRHVPAIVHAWYPGQAGGAAIADVLFGDYNPAGRLPVTFYRSTADLPPFEDYAMKGRTYRYFDGTPLYPFGHGLSYTTFRYDRLRTSAPSLRAGGAITVNVDVTNTGTRTGDEVVQLYVQYVESKVPRPRIELRGYRRVSLKPGETRTVAVPLRADDLAYWDTAADRWAVEPGRVRLRAGGSSTDLRVETTVRVLGR
jgi:beta-glucosidase